LLVSRKPLPDWFITALGALVLEVFILIAVGGSVRTMNAGLACPDWPLCFGDVIPDYHPQVYLEFVHRVMAGLVGLTVVFLAAVLWRSSAAKALKLEMLLTVLLLGAQIVFGGLTVRWQLEPWVVATHLGMGTAFFGLLHWMYLSLKLGREAAITSGLLRTWSIVVMALVYIQILLGGTVASHYAGLACPDWPTCQGHWIPTFSGPVGLQVIHRLSAYLLSIAIAVNWVLNRDSSPRAKSIATGLVGMTVFQLGLGVANVFLQTPPLISVIHLATAVGIFSLAIRQLYMKVAARQLV
jgi:cytochrome c oxidase assembly protein subunit 15